MALPPIEIDVRADTAQAEAGLERVGKSAQAAGKRTERGANAAAAGSKKLGGASQAMRGNLQNTSFQLQDMVVQLQMGTRWTTVMAQQLPQLAGGFGAVGAAIGVLLAVGFTGLGIAMAATGRETRNFQTILDDLEESIGRYQSAVDLSNASTEELREKFGSVSSELRGTISLLDRIAANEAQRAIDDLSSSLAGLLGTAGAGDVRSVMADFFDVNIGLAFTDFQREARAEARLLTAEFKGQQEALAASAGDLDAQIDILRAMVATATSLAQANGEVTVEEEELIKKLASSLLLMEEQRGVVADTATEQSALVLATQSIAGAYENVLPLADRLLQSMIETGAAARETIRAMGIAQATQGQLGRGGAGPGGPMGAAELFLARTGGTFETRETGGGIGGGGGVGAIDTTEEDLEALQQQLATETEIEMEAHAERLELLRNARENQLLTQQEYNELEQRLAGEHADKMLSIDAFKHGSALDQTEAFFGQSANALKSGNEKMVEIGRKFAAIEATINAGRAFAQVASDPSLPWYAKIPAAIGVAAAISSFANKSIGGGGSSAGGGGAGSSVAAAQQEQQPTTTFAFTLQNDPMGFGESFARQMIEQLNATQRNGGRVQGVINNA